MNKRNNTKASAAKITVVFAVTVLLTIVMFFVAVNTGGIETTVPQLIRGLFFEYDKDVSIILELRFPRIIIALLGGALMAASGVCMQAVMRNPLADPGIIGVSSGTALAVTLVMTFIPSLAYLSPIFAFLGGLFAFALVYILAWNDGVSPVRLILVGIAVDAAFEGLYQAFNIASGGSYTGAQSIINANISLETWDDVKLMLIYFAVCAVLCVLVSGFCNLLALSDKTVNALGVNINCARIAVSVTAVLMASIFASVIGTVSFLGLIVQLISLFFVGSDHKILIPYSALLGALVFLSADTVGRSIAYPYEISASIVMAVIGGPLFIFLIKRDSSLKNS
ncbi:MAG: iron ABC transporter permease [Clostridiales bacterium]|nr:iron ABC transporter permease [Clostridiales bacterium]